MRTETVPMMLEIPAVDRVATRRRVEDELERVRLYRKIGIIRREVSTTVRYEARMHGPTNKVGKVTENTAVWNVDREADLERRSMLLDKALSCLGEMERELIARRYLESEDMFDYLICGELGISERKYRRVKAAALYKLALALNLEVLMEE